MFVLYLAIALVLLGVVFLAASIEVRPASRKARPRSLRYEEYHEYPLPPADRPVIAPPVMNRVPEGAAPVTSAPAQEPAAGPVSVSPQCAPVSAPAAARAEERPAGFPVSAPEGAAETRPVDTGAGEQDGPTRFEDVEARSRLEDDDLLCFEEDEDSRCQAARTADDAFLFPDQDRDSAGDDSTGRMVRAVLFEDREGVVSVSSRDGEPGVDSFNRLRRVGKGELYVADEYLSFHSERMMYRYDFRRMQTIEAGEHSFIVRPRGNDCPLLFIVEGSGSIISTVLERFETFCAGR
jgi:hypothetical protein